MKRYELIALLSMLLLLGCGEGADQASKSSKPVIKTKPKRESVSAPNTDKAEKDAQPVNEYSYQPAGKRDPFKSLLDVQRPVAPEQEEPLTPLQKYGLQQLRLLGAVVGLSEPKAMIVAPDGKSYILRIGTKVGKNNGTVIDINSEGVIIEEAYYDFAGDVKKNIKSLKLPEREGVN